MPQDLKNGSSLLTAAKEVMSPVVVYDDDHFYIASCLAELLANAGHQVHYVTPLPMVATWTDLTLDQDRIIERMAQLGIAMHPNTKLTPDGIYRDTLNGSNVNIEYSHIVFVGARIPNDDICLLYTSPSPRD